MRTSLLVVVLALGCSAKTAPPAPNPTQCDADACGPRPGMPNSLCADGSTMAGPTDRCLPTADGCGWEVIECPQGEGPDGGECHPTGCSGTVCSVQDVMTTCEFKPEYACYQAAECTRQANGDCGWTASAELDACLADPPAE